MYMVTGRMHVVPTFDIERRRPIPPRNKSDRDSRAQALFLPSSAPNRNWSSSRRTEYVLVVRHPCAACKFLLGAVDRWHASGGQKGTGIPITWCGVASSFRGRCHMEPRGPWAARSRGARCRQARPPRPGESFLVTTVTAELTRKLGGAPTRVVEIDVSDRSVHARRASVNHGL